jgi:hypothetical protein
MRIYETPPEGNLVEAAFRWHAEEERLVRSSFPVVISNVKTLRHAYPRSRAQAVSRSLQVLTDYLGCSISLACDCAASFVVAHLYRPEFRLAESRHSVLISPPDFTGRFLTQNEQ